VAGDEGVRRRCWRIEGTPVEGGEAVREWGRAPGWWCGPAMAEGGGGAR
jgi:hypothetical protein